MPFRQSYRVSVPGFVRAVKLCRVAHHPWRYGRSHNRTREFSVPSSAPPPRIHLRPDGRTRQRVKQSQFGCKSSSILHFVIRPTSRPGRRSENQHRAVQESVTARLRSDAQVHRGSCDYSGQHYHYLWNCVSTADHDTNPLLLFSKKYSEIIITEY